MMIRITTIENGKNMYSDNFKKVEENYFQSHQKKIPSNAQPFKSIFISIENLKSSTIALIAEKIKAIIGGDYLSYQTTGKEMIFHWMFYDFNQSRTIKPHKRELRRLNFELYSILDKNIIKTIKTTIFGR